MYDFSEILKTDAEVAAAMTDEITRQNQNLELIASENIASKAVMAAMGTSMQRVIRERDTMADASMLMWLRTLQEKELRSFSVQSM